MAVGHGNEPGIRNQFGQQPPLKAAMIGSVPVITKVGWRAACCSKWALGQPTRASSWKK